MKFPQIKLLKEGAGVDERILKFTRKSKWAEAAIQANRVTDGAAPQGCWHGVPQASGWGAGWAESRELGGRALPGGVRQRGEGAGTRPGEQTGCRGGVPFRLPGGRLQPVSRLTLGAREEEGAGSPGSG